MTTAKWPATHQKGCSFLQRRRAVDVEACMKLYVAFHASVNRVDEWISHFAPGAQRRKVREKSNGDGVPTVSAQLAHSISILYTDSSAVDEAVFGSFRRSYSCFTLGDNNIPDSRSHVAWLFHYPFFICTMWLLDAYASRECVGNTVPPWQRYIKAQYLLSFINAWILPVASLVRVSTHFFWSCIN